jgi:hypothetical protein
MELMIFSKKKILILKLGMDGCSLLMGGKDKVIGLLCPSQSEPDYK